MKGKRDDVSIAIAVAIVVFVLISFFVTFLVAFILRIDEEEKGAEEKNAYIKMYVNNTTNKFKI